jgi:hypothetical protein
VKIGSRPDTINVPHISLRDFSELSLPFLAEDITFDISWAGMVPNRRERRELVARGLSRWIFAANPLHF